MEQTFQTIGRRDYSYFLFLVASMVGGTYLMLKARGYLLGYDVSTLLIVGIVFMFLGLPYARYRVGESRYLALVLVPILARIALFNIMTVSWLSWLDDIDALALLCIVAFAEESFRAGLTNIQVMLPQLSKTVRFKIPLPLALLISNLGWLGLHFAQRAFDSIYFGWLFLTGICLSVIMVKVGLGMGVLGHFLVNLTA